MSLIFLALAGFVLLLGGLLVARESPRRAAEPGAAADGGRRCYVLRRDERDRELFHEWGSVLLVFREFLFIGPERDSVERFVIGYD